MRNIKINVASLSSPGYTSFINATDTTTATAPHPKESTMGNIPELTDTVDAIMGFCPGYIINGESKRDGNSDFVTWLWAQDLDTIAAAIKPSSLRESSEWKTEIQKAMEEAEAYATACGDF